MSLPPSQWERESLQNPNFSSSHHEGSLQDNKATRMPKRDRSPKGERGHAACVTWVQYRSWRWPPYTCVRKNQPQLSFKTKCGLTSQPQVTDTRTSTLIPTASPGHSLERLGGRQETGKSHLWRWTTVNPVTLRGQQKPMQLWLGKGRRKNPLSLGVKHPWQVGECWGKRGNSHPSPFTDTRASLVTMVQKGRKADKALPRDSCIQSMSKIETRPPRAWHK